MVRSTEIRFDWDDVWTKTIPNLALSQGTTVDAFVLMVPYGPAPGEPVIVGHRNLGAELGR